MKGIIIYKGKYGSTRQYARWIGAELLLPVIKTKDISGKALTQYDLIILGSSVYIGKLQIAKWLIKNFPYIKDKQIFLYQVAGAPPTDIKKRKDFNTKSLPRNILESCKVYYLAGRLIISKLSWFDRFMLKMGARMTKDPAEKKLMLTDYDLVKKENIKGMATDIRSFIEPVQCKVVEEGSLSCSI